jgi:hypothetical protein
VGLFLGLGLTALGAVCIVAGVQGRGAQLYSALTGGALLGTKVGSAGTAGAAFTPAAPVAGPGSPVTWT